MDDVREHIKKLREDFSKGSLNETDVLEDPGAQFMVWMQNAVEARIIELQSMTLSTVGTDGKPSARIVYLREFGNNEYTFYTNYNSRKAKEIMTNPNVALTIFWPHLERQIRIEGRIEKAPAEQSDNYFVNRPYDSQIGAWASEQSSELSSRDELLKKIRSLKTEYPEGKVTRPPYWGGLVVKASYYEFWQGRESRLHDRIVYTLENNLWRISRLAP